jgi:hypothetical protein
MLTLNLSPKSTTWVSLPGKVTIDGVDRERCPRLLYLDVTLALLSKTKSQPLYAEAGPANAPLWSLGLSMDRR